MKGRLFYRDYIESVGSVKQIYLCSRIEPFNESWKDILSADLTLLFPNVTHVYIDNLRFLALYSHFLVPIFNFWLQRNGELALTIFGETKANNKLEEAALDILYYTNSVTRIESRVFEKCSGICKQCNSITITTKGEIHICEKFALDNNLLYKPKFGTINHPNRQAIEKWHDFLYPSSIKTRYSCAGDALKVILPKKLRAAVEGIWCPYLSYKWSGSLFTPNFVAMEAITT